MLCRLVGVDIWSETFLLLQEAAMITCKILSDTTRARKAVDFRNKQVMKLIDAF